MAKAMVLASWVGFVGVACLGAYFYLIGDERLVSCLQVLPFMALCIVGTTYLAVWQKRQ